MTGLMQTIIWALAMIICTTIAMLVFMYYMIKKENENKEKTNAS